MHMTDAEVKERSTLTLLRIIVRQEEEIEGLRKTLASTAQVAADAEKREADAVSAEHIHKQEWSKPLPTITPDSLRRLADGLANQNSEAERVAARYAASAETLEALRRLLISAKALQQNAVGCAVNHYGDDYFIHGEPGWLEDTRADIEAAENVLAKAERAEP